jgi:predicted nucleic acid-binding protein
MKFLLDTNVFREIGKTKPDANVASWLTGVDDADLAISALTVKEVRKGIVRLAVEKPDIARQIEARVAARSTLLASGSCLSPGRSPIFGDSFLLTARSILMTLASLRPQGSTG